jgi:hypothetical protein
MAKVEVQNWYNFHADLQKLGFNTKQKKWEIYLQ